MTSVIEIFLKVNLNQFRKDCSAFFKKKRRGLHKRKGYDKNKENSSHSIYIKDTSENKQAFFLRLKLELLKNDQFLKKVNLQKKS